MAIGDFFGNGGVPPFEPWWHQGLDPNSPWNPRNVNPQFRSPGVPLFPDSMTTPLYGMPRGVGVGTAELPYAVDRAYGQPNSPVMNDMINATRQRGWAGQRGWFRGAGQPIALPRAGLAAELQGGMYGAGGSTIGQNVIPMGNPSPIPPGAGRGAGAANMPYAPWNQATDELIDSIGRQGPYGGTRGWGRNSGPAYMGETGYPRQVALPQYADQIPRQTGAQTAASRVRPSSIPANAARGTGVGSLPYAPEAYAMGPVREPAPPRQSTLRRSMRSGGMDVPMRPATGAPSAAATGMADDLLGGRHWSEFQGDFAKTGFNAVQPDFITQPNGPPVTPGRGNFFTRNATILGRGAGGVTAPGTPGSMTRNFGRGLMGRAAQGVDGAKPNLRGRGAAAAGRGSVMIAAPLAAGLFADELGGSDTPAGQFAEGFSLGGGFGGAFGAPGALVGGAGVGLGNVLSHAIQGRGIESILGGDQGMAEGPVKDYFESSQMTDPQTGEQVMTPKATIVASLLDPETNVFNGLGLPEEEALAMQEKYNTMLAGTDSQEERLGIVKQAADEILELINPQQQQQEMNPNDLISMQLMASQMMAPIAADSVALGNMQADALQGLQGNLPEAYRQPVQQMIDQAVPRGSRMANAFMQQAYAIPQLDLLQQQQSGIDQMSQQLMAQAMSQVTGGGGAGMDDLSALIAGSNGGGGGSSEDIVNAFANL